MTTTIPGIRPEAVAAVVAAARQLECPELADKFQTDSRLIEMLWFLQDRSLRPGGLAGLAKELVRKCPEFFGPDALRQIISKARSSIDLVQLHSALLALPEFTRQSLLGESAWAFDIEYGLAECEDLFGKGGGDHGRLDRETKKLKEQLAQITPEALRSVCHDAVGSLLPSHLARLCSEANANLFSAGFWYCQNPTAAVLKLMEHHSIEVRGRLAETEVTRRIWEAMDYSWKCRQPVWVHGNARIGKTTSAKAYCEAYPGRARLVSTPASDSHADLLRAVARALGMPYNLGTPRWKLEEAIEWILDNANLQLVFDESHFLYPEKSSRARVVPSRLNWVRTKIIDRDLPCVMLTTPQSYEFANRRLASTRYPLEQWLGRSIFKVFLPEYASRQDLLAVGQRHFPEIPSAPLNELLGRAQQHDGQLKAIEAVSVRAHYLAQQSGRPMSLEDLFQAADEMLPNALGKGASVGKQEPCSQPAEPMRVSSRSPAPSTAGRISRPSLVPA